MSMIETRDIEARIVAKLDPTVAGAMEIASQRTGGLAFANMAQVMEFAKTMAIAQIAIPKHLRGNPGACLGICIQAVEWEMSPFAVANKSYSVNDRLAYEAQLIAAVILRRAPIKGRFKVEYNGDGDARTCRVWANLRDDEGAVEYVSPPFGKITPKNSPLWKSDPDQQHFYYSSRALCRRHFPDVLLGVYAVDEIEQIAEPQSVAPRLSVTEKLDALAAGVIEHDPVTGEIAETKAETTSQSIRKVQGEASPKDTAKPAVDASKATTAQAQTEEGPPDVTDPNADSLAEGADAADRGKEVLRAFLRRFEGPGSRTAEGVFGRKTIERWFKDAADADREIAKEGAQT